MRELLRAPSSPPWEHMATVLLNDLAELPNPLTLALDDYHSIHEPKVHQFLAQVIHYLPEQMHLAIASRTGPPLAVDRLQAGRELGEIRARDLRFSEGETEAYLVMALGPELARESAILLERRTEGWIVGLHLATMWLRGTDNPAGLLAGFGGDRVQFVAGYLASGGQTGSSQRAALGPTRHPDLDPSGPGPRPAGGGGQRAGGPGRGAHAGRTRWFCPVLRGYRSTHEGAAVAVRRDTAFHRV